MTFLLDTLSHPRSSLRALSRLRMLGVPTGTRVANVRPPSIPPPRAGPRPWLSVVVPAYNAGRFLSETLASVAQLGSHDVEVLVVDNGSDTNISLPLDSPVRARVTRLPINRGPAAAFNEGIRTSRGKWVYILHADDLAHRSMTDALRNVDEGWPEATMFIGAADLVDATGEVTGRMDHVKFHTAAELPDAAPRFAHHNFAPPPAVVVKRAVYERVGGFLEQGLHHATDLEMWFRISRAGRVIASPETVASYRIHGLSDTDAGTTSGRNFAEMVRYYQYVERVAGGRYSHCVAGGLALYATYADRLREQFKQVEDGAGEWLYARWGFGLHPTRHRLMQVLDARPRR